jgi:hypothetical protein
MKVISATRRQIVLHPSKHDENWRAFIFDIGIILDKPTPKKVVIQKKVGAYLLSWSMSWAKFLKQICIDTVVIIEKSAFKYESRRTKSVKADGMYGRGMDGSWVER